MNIKNIDISKSILLDLECNMLVTNYRYEAKVKISLGKH